MNMSEDNSNNLNVNKTKSSEEIISGFQKLRNEQRHIFNKLSEFELDLQEHRLFGINPPVIYLTESVAVKLMVIKNIPFIQIFIGIVVGTLKNLHGDRKCFRIVGGILCERTIKDVLPVLKENEKQLKKLVESYNHQLKAKEDEITSFKKEYNLKFKQADEVVQCSALGNKSQDSESTSLNPNIVLPI